MYIVVVMGFMPVLPAACTAGEALIGNVSLSLVLVGKWFVLWSVGVRLLLSGLRQILQPRYTAQVILSLKSDESLILVRELGFANFAIGLVGVGTAVFPQWRPAAALGGGGSPGKLRGDARLTKPNVGRLYGSAFNSYVTVCHVIFLIGLTAIANRRLTVRAGGLAGTI
jgi:hypothetical protein